jgi:hypothetical protein
MAEESTRIDAEPDAARQAELAAAYEANVATGKPPYEGVVMRTYGEFQWVLAQRHWSGAVGLPEGYARADLRGAVLRGTNLSKANLSEANLGGVNLFGANLRGARFIWANLSGADLNVADVSGADLRRAMLSAETILDKLILSTTTCLGDVRWNGASLLRIDWGQLRHGSRLLLGDEALMSAPVQGGDNTDHASTRRKRLTRTRETARAYRGLGRELKDQNLAHEASWCRLSEQRMERRMHFLQRTPGAFLAGIGSAILDLVSGYGEIPARTFMAYAVVVVGFAIAFLGIIHHFDLTHALDALVYSLTSFHGRGFFPGGGTLTAHDPQVVLAAFEAVFGLFIELILIATFSRRFLGS